MKYKKINNFSAGELNKKDKELREELFQLNIKSKTAQLDDKSRIKQVRRDIARVQTKLTELRRDGAKT